MSLSALPALKVIYMIIPTIWAFIVSAINDYYLLIKPVFDTIEVVLKFIFNNGANELGPNSQIAQKKRILPSKCKNT